MMDFKVIDEQVTKGSQDVVLSILTTLCLVDKNAQIITHKVRFKLKSDSYDFQSYAVAEVWSTSMMKWNEVARLRGLEMVTPTCLAYLPNARGVNAIHFETDLARLQKMVEVVLA